MARYDVAVIGAGSAGLSAGALLAKEGKTVIVLDRSQYLGGRGMAVPDEGFKLNVGGHLLEARVRPTLEVLLTESPAYLRRECDPQSGIALIRIDA